MLPEIDVRYLKETVKHTFSVKINNGGAERDVLFKTSVKYELIFLGGVGFDINCGVRLIRTNLSEKDVQPVKEQLAQSLFDHIPVGVGSKGIIPVGAQQLEVCWNSIISVEKNRHFICRLRIFKFRNVLKWVWIGLCVKGIPGQKIRNTVKSMDECFKLMLPKFLPVRKNEDFHRYIQGL